MNVILIIADTMRIDDLGCYGNDWIRTPHLDRFAGESTLFPHHYTEGLPTIPSRHAYYGGRFTWPERGWEPLSPDQTLIQELLWSEGYLTALSTDVYHLFKPSMGFGRGFGFVHAVRGREADPWQREGDVTSAVDSYYLEPLDGQTLSHWYTRETYAQYLRNRLPWDAAMGWRREEDHFSARTVQGAIRWLEEQRHLGLRDRLFLSVDIFAPHVPIDPPPPYDRLYTAPDSVCKDIIIPRVGPIDGYCSEEQLDHLRRLRGGFVTFVDRWVGELLNWLREHDFYDNSLIIFVSDHGDFLGEHGLLMKCRPWPYDILSHAPLIIRHPGFGHGSIATTFSQSCDLAPTMAAAAGIQQPETMQGVSLLPALRDPETPLRTEAIAGFHRRSISLRDERWSFYRWLDARAEKSTPELYNLQDDRHESHDLAMECPALTAEMERRLDSFLSRLDGAR